MADHMIETYILILVFIGHTFDALKLTCKAPSQNHPDADSGDPMHHPKAPKTACLFNRPKRGLAEIRVN